MPKYKYRNIIEKSGMLNNNEWVLYTTEPLTHNSNIIKSISTSDFDDPRLMLTRPVYDIEYEEGLIIKNPVFLDSENSPEITRLLDSLHIISDNIKFNKEISKKTKNKKHKENLLNPSNLLSELVAANFYDCLSCGMPKHTVAVIRYLMENYKTINWDTDIYPKRAPSKDWYTLRDFYNETKNVPTIYKYLKRLPKGVPLLK